VSDLPIAAATNYQNLELLNNKIYHFTIVEIKDQS
jgi:hypothetical protein